MRPYFRLLAAALVFSIAAFSWAQRSQAQARTSSVPLRPIEGSVASSGPVLPTGDPAAMAYLAEQIGLQNTAIAFREQAKAAMKKGDYASAFELLQQAITNDPTQSETCLLLAYFYVQKGQSDRVIATLDPIVNTPSNVSDSIGKAITTRMIYILALLDRNAWKDAVACYNRTWNPPTSVFRPDWVPSHKWDCPGGGLSHDWPNPKFSQDVPDYAGLRAQAHLILGSSAPGSMEFADQPPYMLEHLHQVLRINPNSLDATFLSGWALGKMNRFVEARTAYAAAARLASPDAQKEIKEDLKNLNAEEESAKRFRASQAVMAAKAK